MRGPFHPISIAFFRVRSTSGRTIILTAASLPYTTHARARSPLVFHIGFRESLPRLHSPCTRSVPFPLSFCFLRHNFFSPHGGGWRAALCLSVSLHTAPVNFAYPRSYSAASRCSRRRSEEKEEKTQPRPLVYEKRTTFPLERGKVKGRGGNRRLNRGCFYSVNVEGELCNLYESYFEIVSLHD